MSKTPATAAPASEAPAAAEAAATKATAAETAAASSASAHHTLLPAQCTYSPVATILIEVLRMAPLKYSISLVA
jgi:hypothetical protein